MMAADQYSLKIRSNRDIFKEGMRDGIPISLGYFAVAFALGIMAKDNGISPFQGFLASALTNASAGEYAAFSLIGAAGTYAQMALIILIANARYLLMSLAMSQRLQPKIRFRHRLLMAFDITDELFAIAISREGYLNPNYTYGAVLVAIPGWAFGTMIGCAAGSILPARLISALSVALFGMFIAVLIPASKKDKAVAAVVVASFIVSYASSVAPVISSLSSGTRIIILTIVLSSLAAVFLPRKENKEFNSDMPVTSDAEATEVLI